MSDNASAALASTSMLIERVRELVQSDFTEEQLSAMSPDEKTNLIQIRRVGCFPHICCLLAKHGIEEEVAHIEPLIPPADQ